MALVVEFGNGGASTLSSFVLEAELAAAVKALEAGTEATEVSAPGVGSMIDKSSVNVAGVPSAGTKNGTVEITLDNATGAYNFDVTTAWNTVKNVLAVSSDAEKVMFQDFVHTDITLGTGGGLGTSVVDVVNAKRGNVTTGEGGDIVNVSLVSNEATWVNAFNVKTNGGNDSISFGVGTGPGITNGSATTLFIDAGAGNDIVDLSAISAKSATIIGGAGTDRMIASGGVDTFVIKNSDTSTSILKADVIENFSAGDKIDLDGARSNWTVTELDAGQYLLAHDTDKSKVLVEADFDMTQTDSWFI